MIGAASKDAVAEAARMLSIHVAHYQRKFGVMPFDEAMDLVETESLN
jgi:hypothetical protein